MPQQTNAQAALLAAAATYTGSAAFVAEESITRRAEALRKWLDTKDQETAEQPTPPNLTELIRRQQ